MESRRSTREVLDAEFLSTRAKILEVAAALDRVSRAEGEAVDDGRWSLLRDAIEILLDENVNRAETVQLLFSRAYDENWRETLAVK